MARKSDNYSIGKDIQGYYRGLVELRWQAGQKLSLARKALKRPQNQLGETGEPEEIEEFRRMLNQLIDQYFYKFGRRKDVEKPKCIKDESYPPDVEDAVDYTFEDCEKIYYKISELQEKLGHTSIATQEWEETENKGGKKTADEIEEKLSDKNE